MPLDRNEWLEKYFLTSFVALDRRNLSLQAREERSGGRMGGVGERTKLKEASRGWLLNHRILSRE